MRRAEDRAVIIYARLPGGEMPGWVSRRRITTFHLRP